MKKRSVILKITHLSPKKTFANLIDSRIELDSIRKLLLKFFYTNCHTLITHVFFNTSFPLKSCEMQSGVEESSHSGVVVAQFTSSLFLTLCIVTGIIKSLPLWEIFNSSLSQSIAYLYFL